MSSTAGGGGGGAGAAGFAAGLAAGFDAGFCAADFFFAAGFSVAAADCCAGATDGRAQASMHAATQAAPVSAREGEASMARLYAWAHVPKQLGVNMFYGMTWKPRSCTSLQQ